MNNILEFILKNSEGSFLYKIDLIKDISYDGSCRNCTLIDICGVLKTNDRLVKKEKTGEWKVQFTDVVCDMLDTFDLSSGFSVKNFIRQELKSLENENDFISFSEEDYIRSDDGDTINCFTTTNLIEVFCKSGFCPIKRKNLKCFKTFECPFKEIFEKYETEIVFLPPTP